MRHYGEPEYCSACKSKLDEAGMLFINVPKFGNRILCKECWYVTEDKVLN